MDDPYTPLMPDSLRGDTPPVQRDRFRDGSTTVHVERWGDPEAERRVLFLHGAGGHAGMLAPYAAAVAARGIHVIVPDLPGYGRTHVADRGALRYEHWVRVAGEMARAEREDLGARITLVGASLGGMLAYDVATRTGAAHTVVATCLLDLRERHARRHISHMPWMGVLAPRLMRPLAGPLARVTLPVRLLTDMRAISNRPELTRVVLRDRLGGGNSVPLGFLRSYLESRPATEPEDAEGFSLVLAHPEEDRWTPVEASLPFFERLAVPTRLVMLPDTGHLPAEEPGVSLLISTIVESATPG
ncbi:alpha/beta hydrolase [Nocardiopsis sp. MG754419]|uniref:alpha/beta hydrolase n=1 Tax=Nocardiopsis sp. MG754419 TaxID=2259865 RepID=UPI001BAE1290|nr:alpha/beta hydrolase [Nocardiopsis sp. MG754419]MBR8740166.1 alpha/beta hydrolase [Nocardiopsis sp. MG754419]